MGGIGSGWGYGVSVGDTGSVWGDRNAMGYGRWEWDQDHGISRAVWQRGHLCDFGAPCDFGVPHVFSVPCVLGFPMISGSL